MKKTGLQGLERTLLVAGALTLLGGCAGEGVAGPAQRAALLPPSAAARVAPDLTGCEQLEPPAGSQLAFRAYAVGVQIYRWNGTAWSFVAPDARLFADADGRGLIGTHYAGPTWESTSGGQVFGSVIAACPKGTDVIAWLLLGTTGSGAPGVFRGVTHIQRVNTVSGTAPTAPGSLPGQEQRVPYTAEYLFYRGQ